MCFSEKLFLDIMDTTDNVNTLGIIFQYIEKVYFCTFPTFMLICIILLNHEIVSQFISVQPAKYRTMYT